jgi:hypothetical protein
MLRQRKVTLTLLLAIAISPSLTRADSLSVYVAYADNLRPSGFFPSLWLGDPNVVSQSSANMSFDSGAVRIDNTGASAINITNFSVSLDNGAYTFNIWAPLNIAPGQSGIFTETASYNFDSSDYGEFGSFPPANLAPNNYNNNGNPNLIGGCSSPQSLMTPAQLAFPCSSTWAPVVSFNENGHLMSFIDTGFILDTGQWDFVNNSYYGEDGNESINWNAIGGSSRGGTPEPASLLLCGAGLAATALLRRRSRKPNCT